MYSYWTRFRRGKERGLTCPMYSICLELAGSKRDLHAWACPYCEGMVGYVQAHFHERTPEQMEELFKEYPDWKADDEKFKQEKAKLSSVKEQR